MLEIIHRFFNHPGLRKLLLRLRMPIFLILVLAWPWLVRSGLLKWAMLISVAGVLIQWWCFACLEKEKVLTIRGPYQLCRNPMYLGRYLLILGFIVATGSWLTAAGYSIVYYFYMVNRVKREEPVLDRIFGEPYREYCRDVNRFLPGIRRMDRDFFFFDWQIMLSNNGHWNLVSVLAGYGYIAIMLKWVAGTAG